MKFFRPKYSTLSDEELMIELSRGNKMAFNEIYNRYSKQLRGYFFNMFWRDKEKAEDFVHDLFAKIIRNPGYFDVNRSFKTWLFSVASNMCKNEFKKLEVRKNTSNGVDEHRNVTSNSNVLSEVQDNQFKEAFEETLETLDEKHREVFTLRHFDGLSLKEIAEIMGINEGTVKSRLFYATKHLAEKLKSFNPALNY